MSKLNPLAERLDCIEQRVDRIEQVLVSLAGWLYGWGLAEMRHRFLRPGEESTPYNRGKHRSPFEPIADLFKT